MGRLFIVFFCLLAATLRAQDYRVDLEVKNLPADAKPILLRIYNGNLFVLDSVAVVEKEHVTFRIPANTAPGMLKTILGTHPFAQFTGKQPIALDFLFNKEDIALSTDFNNPVRHIEVIRSEENRIYFDYVKTDNIFSQKLSLLGAIVVNYPEKDEYYRTTLDFYKKIQIQRNKYIDKISVTYRNTLAGRIVKNQKVPYIEANISQNERDSVFRENFLSHIDFSDTTLLSTNIYTDKVFQFVQLYMKREASPRENEANCIQALDRLIPLLDVDATVQQHLLQFLIAGFESMKMEEVLAHISANYLQQCGGSGEIVKRRLEGYSKMAIGQIVPDFTLMDIDNNPVNLYSRLDPYILLIFWHTGCGHCQQLMQELPQLCRKDIFTRRPIRIIGISIDDHPEDWQKFSAGYTLDWINTYTADSFDSPIASDYNLFATPSMFLLDEHHRILAKPTTLQELEKNISDL